MWSNSELFVILGIIAEIVVCLCAVVSNTHSMLAESVISSIPETRATDNNQLKRRRRSKKSEDVQDNGMLFRYVGSGVSNSNNAGDSVGNQVAQSTKNISRDDTHHTPIGNDTYTSPHCSSTNDASDANGTTIDNAANDMNSMSDDQYWSRYYTNDDLKILGLTRNDDLFEPVNTTERRWISDDDAVVSSTNKSSDDVESESPSTSNSCDNTQDSSEYVIGNCDLGVDMHDAICVKGITLFFSHHIKEERWRIKFSDDNRLSLRHLPIKTTDNELVVHGMRVELNSRGVDAVLRRYNGCKLYKGLCDNQRNGEICKSIVMCIVDDSLNILAFAINSSYEDYYDGKTYYVNTFGASNVHYEVDLKKTREYYASRSMRYIPSFDICPHNPTRESKNIGHYHNRCLVFYKSDNKILRRISRRSSNDLYGTLQDAMRAQRT